jgi:NADH dehydrogenase FAD-containing subunit
VSTSGALCTRFENDRGCDHDQARRILAAFEHAERATDEAERAKFLTFVVIGGNPTGVELAGTIAERARDTLRSDFRNFDTRKARVVLIEAGPRILPGFRESLFAYARQALTNFGVDVTLGRPATKCTAHGVEIDGRYLPAKTILWAAGVAASPLRMFPLPHPSWHNTRWLKCNPWFETDMLPVLRANIRDLLS